jgi:hypothetical protein
VDVRLAYCSAVDRNVPVRLKTGASARERLSLHDPADLVCLDYGVRCTGWCCPLFSVTDDAAPVIAGLAVGGPRQEPTRNPHSQRRWTPPT